MFTLKHKFTFSLPFLACLSFLGCLACMSCRSKPAAKIQQMTYFQGFAHSQRTAVQIKDAPYKTLMFPPSEHGFYGPSVSKQGYLLFTCAVDKNDPPKMGICLLDPKEPLLNNQALERIVAHPTEEQADLFGAQGDGEWIVYGKEGPSLQIVAKNIQTGRRLLVGQIESGQVHHQVGPFFTISAPFIVWVDEKEDAASGRQNTLKAFDLVSGTTRTLLTIAPSHEIDRVSLDGTKLVYSEADLTHPDAITSSVYLYDLVSGQTKKLSSSKASQPRISFPSVVWKTETHFSSGGIFLYNLNDGKGQEIRRENGFPKTYDWPSVSALGVTYIQNGGAAPVWFQPIPSLKVEQISSQGGFTELAGHYMVWAGHPSTEKTPGPASLFWADLSQK